MVIDTSAVFAAIRGEQDSARYRLAIANAASLVISSVTLLETRVVLLCRFGASINSILVDLVTKARLSVVPFDKAQADAAFDAYSRYGKGQGHKAQLNIVDCAAYALAKSRNLPLLYKGNDFTATDITPALLP